MSRHEIVGDDLVRCRVLRLDLPVIMTAHDARGEFVDASDPAAEEWFCGGCGDRVKTSGRHRH